jgi:thioredoxin-like negative regulator of GroEL
VIERLLDAERAMSFGQIDQAQEIYEQVSTSDPKNSIAVVGLARVALERGDELGAYLLARRALGIDPENDAARRMAVRLEEVLATRGRPVDDPLPADALERVVSDATPAQARDPVAPPRVDAPRVDAPPVDAPPVDAPPAPETAGHIPKPASPPKRKGRSLLGRLRRR